MMPHVHERSAWSTSSTVERLVLLAVAVAALVTAVGLYVTGYRSIFFAVLGIAAVATVGFVFTALMDEDDELLAADAAAPDDLTI